MKGCSHEGWWLPSPAQSAPCGMSQLLSWKLNIYMKRSWKKVTPRFSTLTLRFYYSPTHTVLSALESNSDTACQVNVTWCTPRSASPCFGQLGKIIITIICYKEDGKKEEQLLLQVLPSGMWTWLSGNPTSRSLEKRHGEPQGPKEQHPPLHRDMLDSSIM